VFVDRATQMPSVKSGGSATGLSVTERCHGRGGDNVLCTFAVLGTGQYCSVFESIPLVMFLTQTHLRDEPGSAKAGMIIIESDDRLTFRARRMGGAKAIPIMFAR
jgi:hypothetical protein